MVLDIRKKTSELHQPTSTTGMIATTPPLSCLQRAYATGPNQKFIGTIIASRADRPTALPSTEKVHHSRKPNARILTEPAKLARAAQARLAHALHDHSRAPRASLNVQHSTWVGQTSSRARLACSSGWDVGSPDNTIARAPSRMKVQSSLEHADWVVVIVMEPAESTASTTTTTDALQELFSSGSVSWQGTSGDTA